MRLDDVGVEKPFVKILTWGRVGLLAHPEAACLWLSYRLVVLVQYKASHSRRLPPVAPEAERDGPVSRHVGASQGLDFQRITGRLHV